MTDYRNIIDKYFVSQERTVLTFDQLHIPGIRMFAKHTIHKALEPLDLHYHENAFEFTLLTEGTLTFSTKDADYDYYGGDVFISPPNEVHGSPELPFSVGEFYWFQLDVTSPHNFLFLNEEIARSLIDRLAAIPHHVVHTGNSDMVHLLTSAFHLALTENEPQAVAASFVLFLNLLILASQKNKANLSEDIEAARDYIMEHIYDQLSLNELAKLASLSTSQFKQKFKAQIGISPRNYINLQKIESAKKSLAEGTSVTDTAMQLNFDTSNYFSAVFKKYTAMTPSEYVKKKKYKSGE